MSQKNIKQFRRQIRKMSDKIKVEGLERNESESKLSRWEQRLSPECNSGRGADIGEPWKFEPAIRLLADGLPSELDGYQGRLAVKSYDRVNRLKGLGNAIVPQIAQLLFEQIKPFLTGEK